MMKKILALAAALVLAIGLVPSVEAQNVFDKMVDGEIAGRYLSAVSTDVKLLVRYVGSNSLGGTVTVAAGGDITFSVGAVGASAVDTNLECDSSIAADGSRSGIFVLSSPHANCNTLGEVVDLINASNNWRAVILDGLRSDGTDNTFAALSETAANSVDGLGLLNDGAVALHTTIAVVPLEARKMSFYLAGKNLRANPFSNSRAWVGRVLGQSTYGSGTSAWNYISDAQTYSTSGGASTETTVWNQAAAATATDQEVDFSEVGGFHGRKGEKLLVRVTNSAAMSAANIKVWGLFYQF